MARILEKNRDSVKAKLKHPGRTSYTSPLLLEKNQPRMNTNEHESIQRDETTEVAQTSKSAVSP